MHRFPLKILWTSLISGWKLRLLTSVRGEIISKSGAFNFAISLAGFEKISTKCGIWSEKLWFTTLFIVFLIILLVHIVFWPYIILSTLCNQWIGSWMEASYNSCWIWMRCRFVCWKIPGRKWSSYWIPPGILICNFHRCHVSPPFWSLYAVFLVPFW